MSVAAIEQLLKQTMGLDAASVGSSVIHRAVEERMQRLNIDDPVSYHARLLTHDSELAQLIEEVVVPETWFFRDQKPFEALRAEVGRPPLATTRPLRILSVPCSTGEEPYTIAMVLRDAGLSPADFRIDAVDISRHNLERARRASYRAHSFRGDDLAFRDRYFQRTEQGYHLKPEIRDSVNFQQANLLDADFASARGPYQVIFCRNLLIYFDRETQQRAVDTLESLLARDGLLFVGHAETAVLGERCFEPLEHARCFGFRRCDQPQAARPSEPEASSLRWAPLKPRRRRRGRPHLVSPLPEPAPVLEEVAEETPDPMEEAARLADEGHLAEAARICEGLIAERNEPQAFYLLALIRDAAGEPEEAETLLRKAIYLDPRHAEAMTQLALLLERRGEQAESQRLRQRIERCLSRSG